MNFSIRCDKCSKAYRISEKHFGKKVSCAACGHVIQIPVPKREAGADANGSKRQAGNGTKSQAGNSKSPPPPARSSFTGTGPSPQTAGQQAAADLDAYEIDPLASGKPTNPSGEKPSELGYTVQPQVDLDDDDDEFELEPPITTPKPETPILEDADPAEHSDTAPRSGNKFRERKKPNPPQHDNDDAYTAAAGLVVDLDHEESAKKPVPTKACPECQQQIPESAVLCVHCGLNLRTGEKLAGAPTKKRGGFGKLFGKREN